MTTEDWREYYKGHPFPVRGAHKRFFIDKEQGILRMVRFPYYRDIAFWHYGNGFMRWLIKDIYDRNQ